MAAAHTRPALVFGRVLTELFSTIAVLVMIELVIITSVITYPREYLYSQCDLRVICYPLQVLGGFPDHEGCLASAKRNQLPKKV